MSEDLTSPSGAITEPSGGSDEIKSAKAIEEKNRKLLAEKKALQDQFESMKSRLDEIETQKLEQSGKLKEYADNLKRQLDEEKKRSREVHKNYSSKMLKASFAKKAAEMGTVDIDLAYMAIDKDGIEIKDDFSFDESGIAQQLSELQKAKPYLFKKDAIAPKDGNPINGKQQNKQLSDMDLNELYSMLGDTK